MTVRRLAALLGLVLVPLTAAAQAEAGAASDPLRQAVWDTERAFAKTMADRDIGAFAKFLSADAVFQGAKSPLRGPEAVVAAWKKFFEGAQAPFSWEPDQVLVMNPARPPVGGHSLPEGPGRRPEGAPVTTGQLAMSSGPVRDPSGQLVGRFNSVWRQESPGVWRIVLDMGSDACECKKP